MVAGSIPAAPTIVACAEERYRRTVCEDLSQWEDEATPGEVKRLDARF
jgi:hypothetical protein